MFDFGGGIFSGDGCLLPWQLDRKSGLMNTGNFFCFAVLTTCPALLEL